MMLHHASWSISRSLSLFRRNLADTTASSVQRGGSCTPTPAAECPPCVSAPPPPCRAAAAARPRGLRVACCPPPAGQRPPCTPPPPSTPRSCTNYKNQEIPIAKSEKKLKSSTKNICEAQLDRVARRLEAAERVRRQDYENEILTACPPPKQPPVSTYRLTGERQCMRATDGHDYTVTNMSKTSKCCDSSRTPPPPTPVELDANTGCQIRQQSYLDPCSHHPRIFIEIDRSAPQPSPSTNKIERGKTQQTKRESSAPETNISSKTSDSWCSNLPTPKHVPPPCKEPSLIERLRRRSGSATNNSCNRHLHTHSATYGPMLIPSVSEKQKPKYKTTSVPQLELQLAEVARGRVVTGDFVERKQQYEHINGGGIDLKIPPTTEAVRVKVSLDFNTPSTISCTEKHKPSGTKKGFNNATNTSDPWLSIKSLQQKLKDCQSNLSKKNNNTKNAKEPTSPEKHTTCNNHNIIQNKQKSCTSQPQHTQPKHNKCSSPQTHLTALT